jgi:hypothetical protein
VFSTGNIRSEKDILSFEECVYTVSGRIKINAIISKGTDSAFAKFKEALLEPSVQVKETCQKLVGLLPMIGHLRDEIISNNPKMFEPPGSPEEEKPSEFGCFLAREIERRIRLVSGRLCMLDCAASKMTPAMKKSQQVSVKGRK